MSEYPEELIKKKQKNNYFHEFLDLVHALSAVYSHYADVIKIATYLLIYYDTQ